jgi:MFS family permease
MADSLLEHGRVRGPGRKPAHPNPERYKWIVLTNTTMSSFMAMVDGTIVLIALPSIFRGIHMNPLLPGNSFYLLWMILGFMVVSSVLVVSFGRLGDMFGRVKMYNLGFALFTLFSLALSVTWMSGTAGANWLIVMRVLQGVGAAFLLANSPAILTDAFPENQRGMALGINQIAGISGTFIGLVLGGLLAPIDWRLVFLISVPVGVFGTLWSYTKLREVPFRRDSYVDWPGNISFALGLIAIMVAVTYGIQPYGGHTMGWTSPLVVSLLVAGVGMLGVFCVVESRSPDPMFELSLFKIRAFTAGSVAGFLASLSRGGLMFIMIIWLQGVWLPLHGYDFASTPLWAGIAMLPLTVGFLLAGPISGILSDRFGARPFTVGGMLVAASSFALLETLPVDFWYPAFGVLLFFAGTASGMFSAPNRAGVMNSLPASRRGVGGGMNSTFNNAGQVLSIGVFFTLMIIGLSSTLPSELYSGLVAHGVPIVDARRAAKLPPVSTLFAAFLGYNPMRHILGAQTLGQLSASTQSLLLSKDFFPSLISSAFRQGLRLVLDFAILISLLGATCSALRGGKFHYVEQLPLAEPIEH